MKPIVTMGARNKGGMIWIVSLPVRMRERGNVKVSGTSLYLKIKFENEVVIK